MHILYCSHTSLHTCTSANNVTCEGSLYYTVSTHYHINS